MTTLAEKKELLDQLVKQAEQSYATALALAQLSGRPKPVRHKCFVSYHGADIDAVTKFVEDFSNVFVPRVVGASDSDHLKTPINSTDEDYIKSQIGSKYLSDSSVTILFVGRCTWSRKYVDWELSSSLRNDTVNKRNGLVGITPSDRTTHRLPARFADNLAKDGSRYASYYYYPSAEEGLRNMIESAFRARTSRADLVNNSRDLAKIDLVCL